MASLLHLETDNQINSAVTIFNSYHRKKEYRLYFNEKSLLVIKDYKYFLIGRKLYLVESSLDFLYDIDLSILGARKNDVVIFTGGAISLEKINRSDTVVVVHNKQDFRSELNLYDLSISLYGVDKKGGIESVPKYAALLRFILDLRIDVKMLSCKNSEEETRFYNLVTSRLVNKGHIVKHTLAPVVASPETISVYTLLASNLGLYKGTCILHDPSTEELVITTEPIEDACISLVKWCLNPEKSTVFAGFYVDEDSSMAVAETLYSDPQSDELTCELETNGNICAKCSMQPVPTCYKKQALDTVQEFVDAISASINSSKYI